MPPQAILKAIHPSEADIQKSIIDYIHTQYKKVIVFSIPNAGQRSFATARFFKEQGLLAGLPDLGIIWSRGHFGMLEIKTPTGRLQTNQQAAIRELEAIGVPVAILRSLDDAIAVLKEWKVG